MFFTNLNGSKKSSRKLEPTTWKLCAEMYFWSTFELSVWNSQRWIKTSLYIICAAGSAQYKNLYEFKWIKKIVIFNNVLHLFGAVALKDWKLLFEIISSRALPPQSLKLSLLQLNMPHISYNLFVIYGVIFWYYIFYNSHPTNFTDRQSLALKKTMIEGF